MAMRICILSRDNVPIGYIDNDIKEALHYYDDTLHMYLSGTAHTFEFKTQARHKDSLLLEVGNKIAFLYKERPFYMNIMTVERDEEEVSVEAWAFALELLNETAMAYTATKAMSFVEYVKAMNFEYNILEIGINEVAEKNIKHEWTSETDTILKRLFSLASVFDAELEFIPVLNDDYTLKNIALNVYRAHSSKYQGIGEKREDVYYRYGKDVNGITKTEDITELYTAIRPYGADDLTLASLGKKEELDANGNVEFVHFAGQNEILAPQAAERFPSTVSNYEKYICYNWKTDYKSVNTLYGNALAKLKELSTPNSKYEIDGYIDVNIGDTITIIDEAFNPPLYLETRVTEQQISTVTPSKNKTIFDNTTELESQIDVSLLNRIESLEKESAVIKTTAEEAKSTATTAQETATTAQGTADTAHTLAQTAKDTADTASETATIASTKADTAQATATDAKSTADTANATAESASSTANTANATATEAKTTADSAQTAIVKTQSHFFHDADGAHVTTTEGDATVGKNVLIDTDSINIRDGVEEIATFASDTIEIGKNSVSSRIDFCKGAGYVQGSIGETGLNLAIGTDGGPNAEGLSNGGMSISMAKHGYIGCQNLTMECGNSFNIYMGDIAEPFGDVYINNRKVFAGGIVKDERKENVTVASANQNTILTKYIVEEDGLYMVTGGSQYKGSTQNNRYDVYVQYIENGAETPLSGATFPYSQRYPCITWNGLVNAKKGSTIQTLLWNEQANCTLLWAKTTIMRLA
jgi:phage minor structural protein